MSDLPAAVAEVAPLRVVILWAGTSGYFRASVRSLVAVGVEVWVAYGAPIEESPFAQTDVGVAAERVYVWHDAPDTARVQALVSQARADAILVSSWNVAAYRHALRAAGDSTARILCMDNQWLERPKQWLGRATQRVYVQPLFDTAFVPGDRQATFARHLGFRAYPIWRGLYCADTAAFGCSTPISSREKAFLYVGRLVAVKAVDVLLEAYEEYQRTATDPWPLRIAGTGPLQERLAGRPGVEQLGFVQPEDLPREMARAAAFVLPSHYEPWGVVIHEAVCAGLPVIATDAVGAAAELVQDGWNGYIVPARSAMELAGAMRRVAAKSDDELDAMGAASRTLSAKLTIERWGPYVRDSIIDLKRAKSS